MEYYIRPILVMICLLIYNFCVACTEGWKWRQDDNKPDTNKLIRYDNYHVWRSITSLAVILLCFTGVPLYSVLSVILSWCGSVFIYERVMSFVQYDDWNKKRAVFHILKWNIPRPPVWIEWSLLVLCYALNFYVIFHI